MLIHLICSPLGNSSQNQRLYSSAGQPTSQARYPAVSTQADVMTTTDQLQHCTSDMEWPISRRRFTSTATEYRLTLAACDAVVSQEWTRFACTVSSGGLRAWLARAVRDLDHRSQGDGLAAGSLMRVRRAHSVIGGASGVWVAIE